MSMLIFCVNWEAVSAISNIVMAAIAFMSLGVSFYLLHKERKQRIEDNRARIDFSIIKHMHGYYLCVENVGKETAYDIKVYVSGLPIENNLYDFVKKVFVDLKDSSFVLKGGAKRYFYISPSIMEYNIKLPWKEKRTKDEINNWLKEYDSKAITINGKYNNKYPIKERFTIRDFNILGTFQIPSSIESIAGVVSDMDTYTLNEIKDSLNNIADKIENK